MNEYAYLWKLAICMMQEFDFHWIIFSLKFKCLPVKLIKFTGEFLAVCKKRDYSKVSNKRIDKLYIRVGMTFSFILWKISFWKSFSSIYVGGKKMFRRKNLQKINNNICCKIIRYFRICYASTYTRWCCCPTPSNTKFWAHTKFKNPKRKMHQCTSHCKSSEPT